MEGSGGSVFACMAASVPGGVEKQRLGQCRQTVVVSRQKPGRLRESQGKLVSQETHWNRIRALLCV